MDFDYSFLDQWRNYIDDAQVDIVLKILRKSIDNINDMSVLAGDDAAIDAVEKMIRAINKFQFKYNVIQDDEARDLLELIDDIIISFGLPLDGHEDLTVEREW